MALDQHLIEVIVGITASIGAIIIILNKFGLIHFGKREEPIIVKVCPAHMELVNAQKDIAKKVGAVHDNQIRNITLHKQHQKRFDSGDIELKNLKKDIKQLCIGVAILLERTGGKPESFAEDS